ncbi:kelch repeat-containing protein [Pontiellaceae bacterium B12219]|nr:kelch repeat-containing protein [Pontiellaceae bacterium B12219]
MKFFICSLLLAGSAFAAEKWETLKTKGEPKARHEAAFVEFEGEFYLLGGRRIQEVSIFNPETKTWRSGTKPPIEVHHFQPVVYDNKIMIVCAMTGKYPKETGLEKILIYEPKKDAWSWGDEIPAARRRGSASVVNVDGKLYVIAGIINGHMGGYVDWADLYDPETGTWTQLKDAPHKRDHFQAAYLDGKIYAAGGRTTSKETGQLFDLTVPEVDVYDISTGKWSVLKRNLPTPRAGNSTAAIGNDIVVAGGESMARKEAHSEVEAWDTEKEKWHDYPSLQQGRHGTALILHENCIYTCSGSGGRGGGPELTTTERLKLDD